MSAGGASTSNNSMKVYFLILKFWSHWLSFHVQEDVVSLYHDGSLAPEVAVHSQAYRWYPGIQNMYSMRPQLDLHSPLWDRHLHQLTTLWTDSVQYPILHHINISPANRSRSRTTSSWTCSISLTQFGRKEIWGELLPSEGVKVAYTMQQGGS